MKQMTLQEMTTYRTAQAEGKGLAVSRSFSDGTVSYMSKVESTDFVFLGFIARRFRAAAYFSFKTREAMERYAEKWNNTQSEALVSKAEHRAARNASHTLKKGDVLYTSWGWEQTNVEFFEVIAVRGRVVDIRELKQDRKEYGVSMSGSCTPLPGNYKGDVITGKRPNGRNVIRIDSCTRAWPWDGTPKSWSSYA